MTDFSRVAAGVVDPRAFEVEETAEDSSLYSRRRAQALALGARIEVAVSKNYDVSPKPPALGGSSDG